MRHKKPIMIVIGLVLVIIISMIVFSLFNEGSTHVGIPAITPTPIITTTVPTLIQVNAGTASLELVQEGQNQVSVQVDSGPGTISAVQLALSYDPRILQNVRIQKGRYFIAP